MFSLEKAKKEEVKKYFNDTFTEYERLFETLACDEAYFTRADPLRHPLIFYYGHTAVFFVNKLIVAKHLCPEKRIDKDIESMLAIGVDEMSWDDLNSKNYNWPTVAKVREYRNQVRALVNAFIDELPPVPSEVTWASPYWIIMMGIEHEHIHLETSSVLIRQLPLSLLKEHSAWATSTERPAEFPQNELLTVPAGLVVLGKDPSGPQAVYAWDNEYGTHQADVAEFKASKYLVSNGEYLEFMEKGKGYSTQEYWTEEGWRWCEFLRSEGKESPRFWLKENGDWKLRNMLEVVDMPWSWPVEVNQLEAKAFCNWKAKVTGKPIRLPTEDEWYRLYDDEVLDKGGALGRSNIDLVVASSVPVNKYQHGRFYDVAGNVWQHTETPIYPMNGFEVHPAYDDFTVPTFDNRHACIKGGSWISRGNEATRDARYAFRRHFYQHAGFRYVESDAEVVIDDSHLIEEDPVVARFMEFHYGDSVRGMPNYPEAIAKKAIKLMEGRKCESALDIGCAVGRSSFVLKEAFDNVVGIDFSTRFIQNAVKLQRDGRARYAIPDEGEIMKLKQVSAPTVGGKGAAGLTFMQTDACNMASKFSGYDLVLASNLIEELYNPTLFLSTIQDRVNKGGLLVLASTYNWSEDCTPRNHWLGGKKDSGTGENIRTIEALHELLCGSFRRVGDPEDIEYALRKTTRVSEIGVSQVTVWERM